MFSYPPPSSLLSLLLLLATQSAAKFLCHEEDAETLLEIKRSFGNPPHMSSWTSSSDCCHDWACVRCDADADAGGRVTALNLQHAALSGPIPPSISRLSHLTALTIVANPSLAGTIPPSIAQLRHLTHLRITDNPLLAGPNLQGIFLFLNALTGPVPGCFGNNISYIDFSGNLLSGPVPASFMSVSTDSEISIDLHGNRVSGHVPASFGGAAVGFVDVSGNMFTDARALFGEGKRTRVMRMSRNRLEFDISRLSFPLGVRDLAMDHNRLTGSIPAQVARLGSLAYFDVSYNGLCGPIPSGRWLKVMNPGMFEHNRCLCGVPLRPCRR